MKRSYLKVIAAIVVAITFFVGGRAWQATEDSKQWNLDYKVAWKAEHAQNYWIRQILINVRIDNPDYWKNKVMTSNEYSNWEQVLEGDFEDFYCE